MGFKWLIINLVINCFVFALAMATAASPKIYPIARETTFLYKSVSTLDSKPSNKIMKAALAAVTQNLQLNVMQTIAQKQQSPANIAFARL